VRAFLRWVGWLWSTRNCEHPRTRSIGGDERRHTGYVCDRRCLVCGKALKRTTFIGPTT
jgi:hypothetical protein